MAAGHGVTSSLAFRETENLLPNPEALNLWPTISNAVVTTNALADVDGLMTAELITDNAIGTTGAVTITSAGLTLPTASVPYRFSVYVKAGTVPWLFMTNTSFVGAVIQTWFNLSTFAVGNVGANVTATGADAAINGWRRIWLTFTLGTDVSGTFGFGMASANALTTVLRDGTKTVNLWLAQLARI